MAAEPPAGPLSAGTVEADAAARAVSPVADELLPLRGSPGFCTNSWRCIMINLALSAPSPHTHGHVEEIYIRVPITVHLAATVLGIRALKSAISLSGSHLCRTVKVTSLAVSPGSGGQSKSRRNCGAVAGRARPPSWRPPRRSGPYTACQEEVSRRRKTRVHSGHGTWDASIFLGCLQEQPWSRLASARQPAWAAGCAIWRRCHSAAAAALPGDSCGVPQHRSCRYCKKVRRSTEAALHGGAGVLIQIVRSQQELCFEIKNLAAERRTPWRRTSAAPERPGSSGQRGAPAPFAAPPSPPWRCLHPTLACRERISIKSSQPADVAAENTIFET